MRAADVQLLQLLLLEQGRHEGCSINGHLFGQLIVPLLDLVLALNTLLLHLLLDLFELILLLRLQLLLLLGVLLLGGTCNLQLELRLNLLIGLVLSFSVLLLELCDFVLFLFL